MAGHLGLDTSRGAVWHLDSTQSQIVGHRSLLDKEHASVSGTSLWWQSESDSTSSTAEALNITFSSAFSATPALVASVDSTAFLFGISAANASGFSSSVSFIGSGATPSYTVRWFAEGYRDA